MPRLKDTAIKYFASNETVIFLNEEKLREVIEKYGHFGIPRNIIMSHADKKVYFTLDTNSKSIIYIRSRKERCGDMDYYGYCYPYWFFDFYLGKQLEFDFIEEN
jgi:HSP90 family molecular chaperone